MNTVAEHDHSGNPAIRLLVRLFLVLCGIGLFVAAGMAGALITLYWLI